MTRRSINALKTAAAELLQRVAVVCLFAGFLVLADRVDCEQYDRACFITGESQR